MSQIPRITTADRANVPGGQLRVPSPQGGSGLAQGLGAASQATQQIARFQRQQEEAERQNELIGFENDLIAAEAQGMQQAREVEQSEGVESAFESAIEPLRDRVEQVEDGTLRQQMQQLLERRRARRVGDLTRIKAQITTRNGEINRATRAQSVSERLVTDNPDVQIGWEQARQELESVVDRQVSAGVIRESARDTVLTEMQADAANTYLNQLTDTRGKSADQVEADLSEAEMILDEPSIRATLPEQTQRVYSHAIQRGKQGLSEAIRAQGLGEVKQAWNRGFLGDEVDREAVQAGMDRLSQLAEEGRIGAEAVTDLATSYIDAIAQGDPRTGPQKLAMIETTLSDEDGIVISPELRESLDRARNQLAQAQTSQDAVDRQVAGLQTTFSLGGKAPENTSPEAWETFEQRAIDEQGHDPAEVVAYMARHDAPLEGVRSRLEDAFSGELRTAEGVRMQRALKPGQRRNLLDGMDDESRVLGSVAFEMLRDMPTSSEQAERVMQTIEQNRAAIFAASAALPSSDGEETYDPSEALMGVSGQADRVPVQMQRELADRFRFLAAQETELGRNLPDLNFQQIANRAGSQVMKRYDSIFQNAPPMPRDKRLLMNEDMEAGLIRALRQRGPGQTGGFGGFNDDVPLFHLSWRNESGQFVVPITPSGSATVTEFATVNQRGEVAYAVEGNRFENARGDDITSMWFGDPFADLRQQMIEQNGPTRSDVDPLVHDPRVHGNVALKSYDRRLYENMRDAAMRRWMLSGQDMPEDDEEWEAFTTFWQQYARDVKGWPRLVEPKQESTR